MYERIDNFPYKRVAVTGGAGFLGSALCHALARHGARVTALDASPAALELARENAEATGLAVDFVRGDMLERLPRGPFDLVVSNPPYVAESDLGGLQREVREHEPRVALTPGGDGLSVIRRLVAEAPRFLKPGGHLLLEIGFNQHERVAALVDPSVWTLLDIHRDLQGIPRTVALRLNDG